MESGRPLICLARLCKSRWLTVGLVIRAWVLGKRCRNGALERKWEVNDSHIGFIGNEVPRGWQARVLRAAGPEDGCVSTC